MHQFLLLIFAHLPLVDGVYIGTDGPFRFAFDTGAESTSIDARLAQTLKLAPQYRVEVVTATASSLAPALRANFRTGAGSLPDTEAILLPLSGLDGILGQSALRRMDYQIDNRAGRVLFNASPGARALALPLVYVANRIAVKAQIGDRQFLLILDSGSNAVLLPTQPLGFRGEGFARILSHNGSASVPYGRLEKLQIGNFTLKNSLAAIAEVPNGLLPTALFRKITVSNSTGMLYLEQ